MEVSNLFVVLMGVGTVFFGLICLILLTMAMSAVTRSMGKDEPAVKAAPAPVTAPAAAPGTIPDRPALAAAIAAAIAEDLGTDITGIRIVSMKKI